MSEIQTGKGVMMNRFPSDDGRRIAGGLRGVFANVGAVRSTGIRVAEGGGLQKGRSNENRTEALAAGPLRFAIAVL